MLPIHGWLALAFVLAQSQDTRTPAVPARNATRIVCTPNTIAVDGDIPRQANNSIAAALSRAAPGARIDLEAGDYKGFQIGFAKASDASAQTTGGTRASPIVVDGHGHARIVGDADAIKVSQEVKNGFITFQNLELSPGRSSAVQFLEGDGWVHEGFRFIDCEVVGHWNHATTESGGAASKFGVRGFALKDFEFAGRGKRVRIVGLKVDGALCLKSPRGDVLIENVDVSRIGGAFVQITSDADAPRPGEGNVVIRNCSAEDCCLAEGDSRAGGGVFTFDGRHTGTIELQNNRFRAGFSVGTPPPPRKSTPFPRGMLVAWDGGENGPAARLILDNNGFEMSASCGDRPLVSIGACKSLLLRGTNLFLAATSPAALELEPLHRGQTADAPVGAIWIDPSTVIRGPIRLRGTNVSIDQLRTSLPRLASH